MTNYITVELKNQWLKADVDFYVDTLRFLVFKTAPSKTTQTQMEAATLSVASPAGWNGDEVTGWAGSGSNPYTAYASATSNMNVAMNPSVPTKTTSTDTSDYSKGYYFADADDKTFTAVPAAGSVGVAVGIYKRVSGVSSADIPLIVWETSNIVPQTDDVKLVMPGTGIASIR